MPIPAHRSKGLVRNLRDGGPRSALGYLREGRIFRLIRRIPRAWPEGRQEVNVLVGHERIPMLLWMAASLMVASKTRWSFVVHDDGSLRHNDEDVLQAALPVCRVIRCKEADAAMQHELQEYPLLASYRSQHAFGKRLTDFCFFSRSRDVVSVDSDILFFADPVEVLGAAGKSENKSLFLRDIKDTSLITPEEFVAKTGRELAHPVNAGMFAIPKHSMDLATMEAILRDFALLDIPKSRWFIEQTVLGAVASLKGDVSLLPARYQQTLHGGLRSDAVMRHYVGKVRHLFYSEGLPKVTKMISGVAQAEV